VLPEGLDKAKKKSLMNQVVHYLIRLRTPSLIKPIIALLRRAFSPSASFL
jgi:hypothetical protein